MVTSVWLLAANTIKANANRVTNTSFTVRAALENNCLITGDER